MHDLFQAIFDKHFPKVGFTSDDEALELLLTYGIKEKRNGVIEEDHRIFNTETWAAVCYLCDEWDFEYIDKPAEPQQGGSNA